jgi:23S rRNA G2445 N2-methylase RlmL
MMSKVILEQVIQDSKNHGKWNQFFYSACSYYSTADIPLGPPKDSRFSNLKTLGEIAFDRLDKVIVVTFDISQDLSERSGKKAQYEEAKRALKSLGKYPAGLFIFTDPQGQFRMSLVYAQYQGTKIEFSNFRRFTYLVDPELTNQTFLKQVGICKYDSLDAIKDAFSVEKVNKQFYKSIASFFERLTGKNDNKPELELPDDLNQDPSILEEFSIRLIGRIVFCWFLKHKKSFQGIPLIPKEVLSKGAIKEKYYHMVLERLFFEVMNKPINNRKPEVSVYVPKHSQIPFLNGGLFEPHNHDLYNGQPNWNLKIPDDWFTDFFEILERYNFTIDENSTVDAEVSVDPEMMGRIFENLLATVNPETKKSARKATGSYYTPRVIVDYMVEQSLKRYLVINTSLDNAQIDELLSYEKELKDWASEDKEAVVKAFNKIKVLDPACGSGAFPMVILQRMIMALEKVDPYLDSWKRLYLSNYHPVMRKIIEDKLKKGNDQYIRKLTIIQDSIYGVDIQPLAVEIAKLRCFLSLVVDEIIVDFEDNRGIEPLPNLEFKFVAANTLMGLPKITKQSGFGVTETVKKLKELREKYLGSFGDDKVQLEQEFKSTQQRLFNENIQWAVSNTLVKQLTEWDPFSYKSCGWFDSEWMFGEKYFDIVIANPPYGFRNTLTPGEKAYFRKKEKIVFSSGDSAELFSRKCFDNLVTENGLLTFIIPKKSLYGEAWSGFRSDYWEKYQLIFLMDASKAFDDVLFEESAFCLVKSRGKTKIRLGYLAKKDYVCEFNTVPISKILTQSNTIQIYRAFYDDCLLNKIENYVCKEKLVGGELGLAIGTNFYSDTKKRFKLLKGIDIDRWTIKETRFLANEDKLNWQEAEKFLKPKVIGQRLIAHIENPVPHIRITACYDNEGTIITNTLTAFKLDNRINELFWLGYLNSTFVSWYAYNFIFSRAIRTMDLYNFYIQQLPLPALIVGNANEQEPIIDLVKTILAITSEKDYLSNITKKDKVKDLEHQIDQLVYQLYDLTPDEIAIVEGSVNQ